MAQEGTPPGAWPVGGYGRRQGHCRLLVEGPTRMDAWLGTVAIHPHRGYANGLSVALAYATR